MGLPISGEFSATKNTDMSAVKRSRTRRLPRLSGLVCLLAITAAHASDNSKSKVDPCNLFTPVPGSQNAGVPVLGSNANDNSSVFQLLAECGSAPISHTPPPPISASALGLTLQGGAVVPTPPSPQSLKQQLATQQQLLAEQEAALANAQATLAIFQGQVNQFCPTPLLTYSEENCGEAQSFVDQWQTAVQTDQKLVAAVKAQIAQLEAQ